MDGNKLLVDTNIILYALRGDEALTELLHESELYISFITRIELLSFPKITADGIQLIEDFLTQVPVIESNAVINEDAIQLRRMSGLEVPDALIAASARFIDSRLMTADKEFKKISQEIDLLFWEL
jgi:predicted nucleic acid-binding protein